jgi:transcriptional regulator with XRE-family HTH domain
MPENEQLGPPVWPLVALDSGAVNNISRGERLRRARERRRLSRQQLADILNIGLTTVKRIERDQVHNSRNVALLEDYLKDYLNDTPAESTPDIAPTHPGPTLTEAADLELVAELARRLASRRENDEPTHPGTTGVYRWPTTAGPYPEPHTPPTSSERRVADGGTSE